jgi:hypothetical protein
MFGIDHGWGLPPHASPTQHFTMVFNALVMMIQFNELNARRIHDERNVFQGIHLNWIYCAIWVSTFTAQVLIVEFGGTVFSTASLNWSQWLVCLGCGLGSLAWHQVS